MQKATGRKLHSTRGGRKISWLFMLLSFNMQLPTYIIHERKLNFIAYKSVSLFSVRSVYTRSSEHLNKVGIRATMRSKPEEQISVIKFLLSEGEKPCHIFQKLQKSFSKACISFTWQLLTLSFTTFICFQGWKKVRWKQIWDQGGLDFSSKSVPQH